MSVRGLFVVFEGLDRTGKTTQVQNLCQHLEANGEHVLKLAFPDRTTQIGKILDQFLKKQISLTPQTAHLLFSANRWELDKRIRTALEEKTHVICDRYAYSGVAYTSAAQGLDFDWCKTPDAGLVCPDIVIFLESKRNMLESRGSTGEIYERQEIQAKVQKCFHRLRSENNNTRWKTLDADRPVSEIVEAVTLEVTSIPMTSEIRVLW